MNTNLLKLGFGVVVIAAFAVSSDEDIKRKAEAPYRRMKRKSFRTEKICSIS